MTDENEKQECDGCGELFEKSKMIHFQTHEQEYPGAYVWTWDNYNCPACDKVRTVQPFTIQENKRGW